MIRVNLLTWPEKVASRTGRKFRAYLAALPVDEHGETAELHDVRARVCGACGPQTDAIRLKRAGQDRCPQCGGFAQALARPRAKGGRRRMKR